MPNLPDEYKNVELTCDMLNLVDVNATFELFLTMHIHLLSDEAVDLLAQDYTEDELSERICVMFDMLDEIAPIGCYFGDNGARYGFWEN